MKRVIILAVVLVILLVAGFILIDNPNKIKKYSLDSEYYKKSELIEINKDEYKKLVKDKKNFSLFVYLPGCTSCAEFKGVLEEYQKDNKITIFQMKYEYINGTEVEDYVKYAPSLVLFKSGSVTDFLDSESDEDMKPLTKTSELKKWIEKRINIG